MQPMPDHIKEKIIMFFIENSVPQIIEAERKERKEAKVDEKII